MRGAPAAERGHADFTRTRLRQSDELGDSLDGKRRIYIHHERKGRKTCHRCKIAQQIEWERIKERRIDGIRSRDLHQGVPIGWRCKRCLDRYVSARAWFGSTMTGWPSRSVSHWLMMRARMSEALPGGNPM